MVRNYIAVMAVDSSWGVGKDNDLPWPKNKEDLESFKEITSGCIIVMGRKTWESIGSKKLPNRINIVISSSPVHGADMWCSGDLEDIFECIEEAYPTYDEAQICIIGGAGLIKEMHDRSMIGMVYLSTIEGIYGADVFFDKTILDDMVCYHKELLRDENPKTILKIYAKGTGENASIQRYDKAYA